MVASFADAFKAIKSLSKKQREKIASEVMHKVGVPLNLCVLFQYIPENNDVFHF